MSREILLVLKTLESKYPALESELKKGHPYECPEIVAWPLAGGQAAYLAWVRESVQESLKEE
ncbi:MAG: divalent-cation tolerance protein CutA [Blastochloris sp.]|nr:divalent-cation tolerance protein CutA [Blastochloris sp.]